MLIQYKLFLLPLSLTNYVMDRLSYDKYGAAFESKWS